MGSWVYLFSKFTSEALLFEAGIIFLLSLGYAAFWILRKRKLGVIENTVPRGVVKDYLNELIGDAEELRAQLFGLLAARGTSSATAAALQALRHEPSLEMPTSPAAATAASSTSAVDPEVLKKVAILEAKITEQTRAIEGILAEKAQIERDLAAARAQGSSAASGAGSSDAELQSLREKIQSLEGRLAEYSVIEDDLANLKRLQQENAQLKSTLASMQGGATATKAASTPTQAPAPAPVPEPAPPAEEPAPPVDPLALDSLSPESLNFENLSEQVNESLKPTPSSGPAAAAPSTGGKSDDDLVAEFEKMLNS